MPSEDNIRQLLRKSEANIFDEVDDEEWMRETYGTGITQVGPRSRRRPGRGKVKTLESDGRKPFGPPSGPTGMRKRSSPSDT